jgi:hypothetical protein
MVSIGPYNQAYDMQQFYSVPDLRGKDKPLAYAKDSLMDIINTHPDFTLFSKIVRIARYDITLGGIQANFTIFVPSDSYLKSKYRPEFFDKMDVGLAKEICTYSSMNRVIDKRLLTASPSSYFPTVNRSNALNITTIRGVSMIGVPNCSSSSLGPKGVEIIHFDQPATNGLIHVTSDILIPATSQYAN